MLKKVKKRMEIQPMRMKYMPFLIIKKNDSNSIFHKSIDKWNNRKA